MSRIVECYVPIIINGQVTEYLISDAGNVKSLKTNKILKQNSNNKGYMMVQLCIDGVVKVYTVHRLVAIAFIENPDNLPLVNHKNSKPYDNDADNLEWCDQVYNMQYAVLYGNAKMDYPVEIIKSVCRELEKNELTIDEISLLYNIERKNIYRILRGKYKTISKSYIISNYNKDRLKRKIDDETVHEICKLIQDNNMSLKEIAKFVDVNYSAVKDILYKKSRRSISDKYDFSKFNKYTYGNQYKQQMSR